MTRSGGDVFEEGDVGVALNGNLVVVVDDDQLAEAQGAREGCRLGCHAFLEVPVGGKGIGVMVYDLVAGAVVTRGQPALREGHADGVGQTLAQRAGGYFNAGGEAVFGVPGGPAAPLTELLEFLHGKIVTRQMEHGIKEGGGVTGGEDEAVAVGPVGIGRIVLEETVPQHVCHRGSAHRCAGMPGPRLLDCVYGQQADGVNAELVKSRNGQGNPL